MLSRTRRRRATVRALGLLAAAVVVCLFRLAVLGFAPQHVLGLLARDQPEQAAQPSEVHVLSSQLLLQPPQGPHRVAQLGVPDDQSLDDQSLDDKSLDDQSLKASLSTMASTSSSTNGPLSPAPNTASTASTSSARPRRRLSVGMAINPQGAVIESPTIQQGY